MPRSADLIGLGRRALKDADRGRDLERRHQGVAQAASRLDHVTVIRPELASQPVEEHWNHGMASAAHPAAR